MPQPAYGLRVRSAPVSGGRADMREAPVRANNGREQVQQRMALFDHFVGSHEHGLGNADAERPGRLEVDHQLDFRDLLDR